MNLFAICIQFITACSSTDMTGNRYRLTFYDEIHRLRLWQPKNVRPDKANDKYFYRRKAKMIKFSDPKYHYCYRYYTVYEYLYCSTTKEFSITNTDRCLSLNLSL